MELRPRLADELLNAYRYSALEAEFHSRAIKEVFALLRSAAIEPILIKGWAIARFYPLPGLRPYEDIDLCLRKDQRAKAETVLKSREGNHHDVDLVHYEIEDIDYRSWEELYENSQLARLDQTDVRVCGPEDHLRLLCIHLLKHGASGPLWLCDIGLMVESLSDGFGWERCLGRKQPHADWVACAIGLAHQLLGARIEGLPVARRARDLPGWLLATVLKQWQVWPGHDETRLAARIGRRRGEFVKALLHRWPNGIEATVASRAAFNDWPRLPFQLATYFGPSRIRKFIRELPQVRRAGG